MEQEMTASNDTNHSEWSHHSQQAIIKAHNCQGMWSQLRDVKLFIMMEDWLHKGIIHHEIRSQYKAITLKQGSQTILFC